TFYSPIAVAKCLFWIALLRGRLPSTSPSPGRYCHDLLTLSPFGTGRHLIQATPGTLRRLQAPTDLRRCHHEDRDSNHDEPRTQNGVAAVGALTEHIIVAGYRR